MYFSTFLSCYQPILGYIYYIILEQWFLTLLRVPNPTSFICGFTQQKNTIFFSNSIIDMFLLSLPNPKDSIEPRLRTTVLEGVHKIFMIDCDQSHGSFRESHFCGIYDYVPLDRPLHFSPPPPLSVSLSLSWHTFINVFSKSGSTFLFLVFR